MITIRFERSETMTENLAGRDLGPDQVTVDFDTTEGQWIQMTYGSIRSQDGTILYEFDSVADFWVGPDRKPFSDVIIEFKAGV